MPIYAGIVFFPVWGRRRDAIRRMSEENPIELLDRLDSLDHQGHLQAVGHGDDCLCNKGIFPVPGDITDEGLVELDRVDRQLTQIAE